MDSILTSVETQVLRPLVGGLCAHRLRVLDPDALPCLKLLISKCLGLGIILGGTILKVPQIVKIVRAGKADGVSFLSYLLETAAYAISLAYNYRSGNPFSTYGESEYNSTWRVFPFDKRLLARTGCTLADHTAY